MTGQEQLCKLTDQDGYTRRGKSGETLWGHGVTRETSGDGGLCGPGFTHYYSHPLLAVLHNPIHANISSPRLWAVHVSGEQIDDLGLKRGATSVTTAFELAPPTLVMEERIRYALIVADRVCHDPIWEEWAQGWLSGRCRSREDAAFVSRHIGTGLPQRIPGFGAIQGTAMAALHAAWLAADNPDLIPEQPVVRSVAYAARQAARESWLTGQPLDLLGLAIQACNPTTEGDSNVYRAAH